MGAVTEKEIKRFRLFLEQRGCVILKPTNKYELLRFKGNDTGVLYNTGKFSGFWAASAWAAFKKDDHSWWGGTNKKRNRNFSNQTKDKLRERDGNICIYCGDKMEIEEETVEHIVPVSKGGSNNPKNLMLMHLDCNKKLADFHPRKKIQLIVENRLKNGNTKQSN